MSRFSADSSGTRRKRLAAGAVIAALAGCQPAPVDIPDSSPAFEQSQATAPTAGADHDSRSNGEAERPATVELSGPESTDRLVRGTKQTFRVVVRDLGDRPAPRRLYLDFYKGKVSSGQFAVSDPEFKKLPDGSLEAQLEAQVPTKPGKYDLRLEVHWGRPEESDPSKVVQVTVE